MAAKKIQAGDSILIDGKIFRVSKSDDYYDDWEHRFVKATRGSRREWVRTDRVIRA